MYFEKNVKKILTFFAHPYMVALTVNGRVAQLVEHLTFNQVAPGSSPGTLTIINGTPNRGAVFRFMRVETLSSRH